MQSSGEGVPQARQCSPTVSTEFGAVSYLSTYCPLVDAAGSSALRPNLDQLCNVTLSLRWLVQKYGELLQVAACTVVWTGVFLWECWISAFTVRETSSGLFNHASVMGVQVVIILKHNKYNVQDAKLFVGHNCAYIPNELCKLCILFCINNYQVHMLAMTWI